MTSPICTVNGSTTGDGVNVAKNSTVTIAIADTAGVKSWALKCLSTDDLQSAASVTGGLTINPTTKVATFTSPNTDVGAALIFESKVNGGLDINGRVDESLTTRFGVYVLTDAGSLRVGAFDETVEGNASFGWLAKFNASIRAAAAAGLTPTVTGTLPIVASGPADARVVSINAATTSLPGSMSAADKTKINTLKPMAPTSPIAFTDVFGTDFISINAANSLVHGSMSAADFVKLGGATDAATASKLVIRDGSAGCSVAALGATLVTASTGFVGPYFSMSGPYVAGSGLLRGNTAQVLVSARDDGDSVNVSCMSWGIENTDAMGIGDTAVESIATYTKSTGFMCFNTGNLALFTNSDFGSGVGVVYIKNAGTVPTTNPTNGVFVYAEGGALKCRGSSGTITVLAPA